MTRRMLINAQSRDELRIAVLSDSTIPSLVPHVGTRPHMRLDVLVKE